MKRIFFLAATIVLLVLSIHYTQQEKAEASLENEKTEETRGSLNTQGHENDIFSDYHSWHSGSFNSNDTLHKMLNKLSYYNPPYTTYHYVTPNKYSFQDINGDGLSDFLYYELYFDGFTSGHQFYAVFLNSGDLNFELVYKCAIPRNGPAYGNCAVGSPETSETEMIGEVAELMRFYHEDGETEVGMPQTTLDMNGDGMVDLITINELLINKGDMEFETVYHN